MAFNEPDGNKIQGEVYEPCAMCEKPTNEDTLVLEVGTSIYCVECFNNL